MGPTRMILPILLTATTVLTLAPSVGAVEFSAEELARLEAGKAVRQPLPQSGKNGFYGGTGWAIINAPVDTVWKAIEDWDSYPKYHAHTNSVRELQRKGDRSLLRMELGYKVLSIVYHVELTRHPKQHKLSFRLAKSHPHDIEDTRGYWRLFPQKGNRTLVAYVIAVQVPKGVVAFLGAKASAEVQSYLLGVPRKLKKWIEKSSGGKYTK